MYTKKIYFISFLFFTIVLSSCQSRGQQQKGKKTVITQIADKMVFVKGGKFIMGREVVPADTNRDLDFSPPHEVELSDFYIAPYELTVAEFAAFIEDTGYQTSLEKRGKILCLGKLDDWCYGVHWKHDEYGNLRQDVTHYPVVYVSHRDALAFCRWLSDKTGSHYRLPTEAEWEYAASGGQYSQGYIYSGGNDLLELTWKADSVDIAHPIGAKKPNELGLYDMSGNVSEWCLDNYTPTYYAKSPSRNPICTENDIDKTYGNEYVVRGGNSSHKLIRYMCELKTRNGATKAFAHRGLGFRIIKSNHVIYDFQKEEDTNEDY